MIVQNHRGRRGSALIETAIVMVPLTMMLFGVFEYGRLLMDWNLVNNAAREGCRYAIVNNTATTISSDVSSIVTTRMSGEIKSFKTFNVTVSGTHNGTATAVNSLAPGDMLMVTISGQYKFMNIVPFITMPSLTINSSVTMICEGGT